MIECHAWWYLALSPSVHCSHVTLNAVLGTGMSRTPLSCKVRSGIIILERKIDLHSEKAEMVDVVQEVETGCENGENLLQKKCNARIVLRCWLAVSNVFSSADKQQENDL